MSNRIATMDATTLYFFDGKEQIAEHFNSGARAIDWLRVMIKHKISQLWVVPSCHVFNVGSSTEERFLEAPDGWRVRKFGEDHLSSIHAYCTYGNQESRNLRSIIWPQHSGWQWQPPMTAIEMLAALNTLQGNLLSKLSSSPGVSGRNYVVSQLTNLQKQHYLTSVEMDLMTLPFGEAKSMAWKRDLSWVKETEATPEFDDFDTFMGILGGLCYELYEDAGAWPKDMPLYVHCIDKNSDYLSALAGLDLGIGDPVPLTADHIAAIQETEKPNPGLYRIKVTGQHMDGLNHRWHARFDGVSGPSLLYGDEETENLQQWVTAPLLKCLFDFGFQIQFLDGWIWNNAKRFLTIPAHGLWQIRKKLKETGGLAYDSIKLIITSTVGLFGSPHNREKKYTRPDIPAGTIEYAKARLAYNIAKIMEEKGIWPLACLTDALWYVSTESDPYAALGSILDRPEELGGFKVEYSLLIDEEVATALLVKEASDLNRELGAIAEKRAAAERAAHDYDWEWPTDEEEAEQWRYEHGYAQESEL